MSIIHPAPFTGRRALKAFASFAAVAAAAGCSVTTGGGDEVPEEQQFVLECLAKGQGGATADSTFTALVWGGVEDLRERGDTVAWAEVPDEDVDSVEDSGNIIDDIITDVVNDAGSEALGFRKDTMAMILVPGGADVLRRDLATRLAGAGYRLADLAMVGDDPATLRAELRRVEVVVKHGKVFGRDEVLASVVVELVLDETDGTEEWRRRLEAENLERRGWQSDAEDYQEVIGKVWCDLLDQAGEAFREEGFRRVAVEGR